MRKSMKVALGGIIAALCIVIMFLSGIIPIATYALPALAGLTLIIIVIEIGKGWALSVYAAVSLLSLMIVADKEAALCFALFFGYYPILKAMIEKIKNKAVQFCFKLAVFNLSAIAIFYISIYILMVPLESFSIMGINLPLVFLLLGNIVFIVYDYSTTLLVSMYINRIRGRIFKNRFH